MSKTTEVYEITVSRKKNEMSLAVTTELTPDEIAGIRDRLDEVLAKGEIMRFEIKPVYRVGLDEARERIEKYLVNGDRDFFTN
jgi:hypothetical protein